MFIFSRLAGDVSFFFHILGFSGMEWAFGFGLAWAGISINDGKEHMIDEKKAVS